MRQSEPEVPEIPGSLPGLISRGIPPRAFFPKPPGHLSPTTRHPAPGILPPSPLRPPPVPASLSGAHDLQSAPPAAMQGPSSDFLPLAALSRNPPESPALLVDPLATPDSSALPERAVPPPPPTLPGHVTAHAPIPAPRSPPPPPRPACIPSPNRIAAQTSPVENHPGSRVRRTRRARATRNRLRPRLLRAGFAMATPGRTSGMALKKDPMVAE